MQQAEDKIQGIATASHCGCRSGRKRVVSPDGCVAEYTPAHQSATGTSPAYWTRTGLTGQNACCAGLKLSSFTDVGLSCAGCISCQTLQLFTLRFSKPIF